jgi:hypothetical protein
VRMSRSRVCTAGLAKGRLEVGDDPSQGRRWLAACCPSAQAAEDSFTQQPGAKPSGGAGWGARGGGSGGGAAGEREAEGEEDYRQPFLNSLDSDMEAEFRKQVSWPMKHKAK